MALVCNYNGRANIHSPCMHRIASHGPFPARSPPSSRGHDSCYLIWAQSGVWGLRGVWSEGARGLGEKSPQSGDTPADPYVYLSRRVAGGAAHEKFLTTDRPQDSSLCRLPHAKSLTSTDKNMDPPSM